MRNTNKKKLVGKLKDVGVLRTGLVKLKHTGNAGFYVDIKRAYGHPAILGDLCKTMRSAMNKRATCVAACGYGGIPLAAAISLKYRLKLVLVREKPKTHGRNARIDGYVPGAKDKVWIVDDVCTTGKSVARVQKTLKTTGAKVLGCGVVVKRGGKKNRAPCRYVLGIKELLRHGTRSAPTILYN